MFSYLTRVEFADTDMAGIMHFSNHFRFMERAEHEFWRSLGISVKTDVEGRSVTWPRVQASCEYKQPLRFEDQVQIDVLVREIRPKSVVFGFRIQNAGSGQVAAEGMITAVCVTHEADRMRAIEIPRSIVDLLQSHLDAN